MYTGKVPAGLLGDNKLYAVWKAKTASVSITPSGSGSDYAYDTTKNEASMTYVSSTSGINLQSVLTVSDMDVDDTKSTY